MSSVSTRAVVGVQGTCEEEVQRIEAFLDTVMGRTQGAAQRVAANEALWKGQGIPWDAAIFASVRANSLHLATLYMSRQGSLTLWQGQPLLLAACLPQGPSSDRCTHRNEKFCPAQAGCWLQLAWSQPETLAGFPPARFGMAQDVTDTSVPDCTSLITCFIMSKGSCGP